MEIQSDERLTLTKCVKRIEKRREIVGCEAEQLPYSYVCKMADRYLPSLVFFSDWRRVDQG